MENDNKIDTEIQEIIQSFDNEMQNQPKQSRFGAGLISASIIVGAVIIAVSIFISLKVLTDGIILNLPNLATNAQQTAALPSAAAAAVGPVKITLKPDVNFLGNTNAKVTVVEYADYECPFCKQVYNTVWPALKTKYVDTGKIKFVYQDFAFLGPDSNTAAEASHCAADQNKFWQYHDYLFSHQGQEGSGWATADHQKQFAQALGLNTTLFNQCLDSGKYKQEVLDETAAGKSYGVTGTPTLFVTEWQL